MSDSHCCSRPVRGADVWPHRLAVVLACATFPLLFIGGLVTSKGAGLAVPDWPTTFGYNMFLYPWSQMVGEYFLRAQPSLGRVSRRLAHGCVDPGALASGAAALAATGSASRRCYWSSSKELLAGCASSCWSTRWRSFMPLLRRLFLP